MIKLWKGIEKEGIGAESEITTLFICSDVCISFDLIYTALKHNDDIKGLYFGAGRKEFAGMSQKHWNRLVSYCSTNNISIAVEVNPVSLRLFAQAYDAPIVTFIVAYYNAPKDINRLYFKTDDFTVTKIFTVQKSVNIVDLVDDRYPDDVVIYEED